MESSRYVESLRPSTVVTVHVFNDDCAKGREHANYCWYPTGGPDTFFGDHYRFRPIDECLR